MDDFGQTYRSTGILVSDRLSLPITIMEPSVVRWRWKLGEGEQMHFSVTFTAAAAKGSPAELEELLLPEKLLSSHSSSSVRLTRPGVLDLRWSMLAAGNWLKVFLLPATARLEYQCRVLPSEERLKPASHLGPQPPMHRVAASRVLVHHQTLDRNMHLSFELPPHPPAGASPAGARRTAGDAERAGGQGDAAQPVQRWPPWHAPRWRLRG